MSDWADDGKGGAYRAGDIIALRVQPVEGSARRYRLRVERAPVGGEPSTLRRPQAAEVVMPWMEAQARSKTGALAEAEARGAQVLTAELAWLREGL